MGPEAAERYKKFKGTLSEVECLICHKKFKDHVTEEEFCSCLIGSIRKQNENKKET